MERDYGVDGSHDLWIKVPGTCFYSNGVGCITTVVNIAALDRVKDQNANSLLPNATTFLHFWCWWAHCYKTMLFIRFLRKLQKLVLKHIAHYLTEFIFASHVCGFKGTPDMTTNGWKAQWLWRMQTTLSVSWTKTWVYLCTFWWLAYLVRIMPKRYAANLWINKTN